MYPKPLRWVARDLRFEPMGHFLHHVARGGDVNRGFDLDGIRQPIGFTYRVLLDHDGIHAQRNVGG